MKKLILITLIIFTALAGRAQTDNHLYGPVPYRTPEQTIGETYLILPTDKSRNQRYTMLSDANGNNLKGPYGGKSIKLIAIDRATQYAIFNDSVGVTYKCLISSDNTFSGVVTLTDFEAAKKMFTNKTLWLNADEIRLNSPLDLFTNMAFKKGLRFDPVTVISVTLGSTAEFPLVFTVKTTDGVVGFVRVNVSGTNSNFDQKYFFVSNFLTEDPKVKYHFSPATWQDIKAGNVALGMDKDAVWLTLGIPKAMNNSKASDGLDQWVYPTQYLYFRSNKLVDIRNQ